MVANDLDVISGRLAGTSNITCTSPKDIQSWHRRSGHAVTDEDRGVHRGI